MLAMFQIDTRLREMGEKSTQSFVCRLHHYSEKINRNVFNYVCKHFLTIKAYCFESDGTFQAAMHGLGSFYFDLLATLVRVQPSKYEILQRTTKYLQ